MLKAILAGAALAAASLALPSAASAAPIGPGAGLAGGIQTPVEQVQYRRWDRGPRWRRGPVRCRIVTERRVRPSGRVVYVRREVCRR